MADGNHRCSGPSRPDISVRQRCSFIYHVPSSKAHPSLSLKKAEWDNMDALSLSLSSDFLVVCLSPAEGHHKRIKGRWNDSFQLKVSQEKKWKFFLSVFISSLFSSLLLVGLIGFGNDTFLTSFIQQTPADSLVLGVVLCLGGALFCLGVNAQVRNNVGKKIPVVWKLRGFFRSNLGSY